MKVLMKAVDMIAWNNKKGKITPIRFQISSDVLSEPPVKRGKAEDDDEDGEKITIHIKHPQLKGEEKLAGNRMLLYQCQSIIDGVEKIYELKYEISTCKWYLYKM